MAPLPHTLTKDIVRESQVRTSLVGRGPGLSLSRVAPWASAPGGGAPWLHPWSGCISFADREAELDDLLRFVGDGSTPNLLLRRVEGPQGIGKTRLAMALCERVVGAWDAGFATSQALDLFFEQQDFDTWTWDRPTLIVVDGTFSHEAGLRRCCAALRGREKSIRFPLRFLLLDRIRSAAVYDAAEASDPWIELFDPPMPVHLVGNGSTEKLSSQVFRRAGLLETDGQLVEAFKQRERSSNLRWCRNPLGSLMAASMLVSGWKLQDLDKDLPEMAMALAAKASDGLALEALRQGVQPQTLKHLHACVTVIGSLQTSEAQRFIAAELAALGEPVERVVPILAGLALVETHEGALEPCEPKCVAIAMQLWAWSPSERANHVSRLFRVFPLHVLRFLQALEESFPRHSAEVQFILTDLVDEHERDASALLLIDAAFSEPSWSSSPWAFKLSRSLLQLVPDAVPNQTLRWRRAQAIHLSISGRRSEAMDVLEQSLQGDDLEGSVPIWLAWDSWRSNADLCLHWARLEAEPSRITRLLGTLVRLCVTQQEQIDQDPLISAQLSMQHAKWLKLQGQESASHAAEQKGLESLRQLVKVKPSTYSLRLITTLLGLGESSDYEAVPRLMEAAAVCLTQLRQRPAEYLILWTLIHLRMSERCSKTEMPEAWDEQVARDLSEVYWIWLRCGQPRLLEVWRMFIDQLSYHVRNRSQNLFSVCVRCSGWI